MPPADAPLMLGLSSGDGWFSAAFPDMPAAMAAWARMADEDAIALVWCGDEGESWRPSLVPAIRGAISFTEAAVRIHHPEREIATVAFADGRRLCLSMPAGLPAEEADALLSEARRRAALPASDHEDPPQEPEGPGPKPTLPGAPSPSDGDLYALGCPLLAHVRGLLAGLPEDEARAVGLRFPEDGAGLTRDGDVAGRLGVRTAEARALMEAGLRRIDEASGFQAVLRRRLLDVRRTAPVPLAKLAAEPWAAGMSESLLRLVLRRYGNLHGVVVNASGLVAVPFNTETWARINEALQAWMALIPHGADFADYLAEFLVDTVADDHRDACGRILGAMFAGRGPIGACYRLKLYGKVADLLLGPGPDPVHIADAVMRFAADVPRDMSHMPVRVILNMHARAVGGDRYARIPAEPAPVPAKVVRRVTQKRMTYPSDRKSVGTPRCNFEWTDERVDLMTRMWRRNASLVEIRDALGDGVTRNAITGKLHRLGEYPRVLDAAPGVA